MSYHRSATWPLRRPAVRNLRTRTALAEPGANIVTAWAQRVLSDHKHQKNK